MGIISSNCKNKPSKFINLSPPFSHKSLRKSISTDNINSNNTNNLFNSNSSIACSMNHSTNSSKTKTNKELNNFNLIGNRLEIPTKINKSSSVSDIIFLNNKDNLVQLTTGKIPEQKKPNYNFNYIIFKFKKRK